MLNSSKALPAPSTVVIALDLAFLDGRVAIVANTKNVQRQAQCRADG